MQSPREPQAEPIPGYRLVEPLGQGGFGEVWKCEAPGGLFKAIKFVFGGDEFTDPSGAGARQELRALQLIKSIRHPFLLSIERIEVVGGEVLIVMELADRSLHDLLGEYRAAGKPGIPRAELLGYLREAAEALDVLNQEYGLQHLDIKPRNLFLTGRHVKVADFGLVTSLGDLQSQSSWLRRSEAVTPLYAAPESFLGRFTLFSDQYSLAITYQELLTGTLPITGRSFRQLALRHVQEPPNLDALSEADRPIVGRALAKEPRERYPSCQDFIQALREQRAAAPQPVQTTRTRHDLGKLAATPAAAAPAPPSAATAATPPPIEQTPPGSDSFLTGYQLLECLHRHAAVEIWKAQTSDGRKRLVKFLSSSGGDERVGGDPVARLRALRHPCLPPLEIQRDFSGRLALIVGAPDGSLGDRLRECQQIGQAGIPRAELLGHLRPIAEALDALYEQHRLQHLCLSPRPLVLREGRLYLLDFALMELFWLPAGHTPAALNTRYAAPELFDQQISRQSDQYSLALIYQELLTGIHAFRNFNQRQMALARQRGKPDLGMLPGTDRPLVEQALQVDPDQRFPTCSAFLEALAAVADGRGTGSRATHVQIATVTVPVRGSQRPTRAAAPEPEPVLHWDCSPVEMKQILAEQIAAAVGTSEIREDGSLRYRFQQQSSDNDMSPEGRILGSAGPALEHCAYGRLVPATVGLKLAGFEEEWKIQPVESASAAEVNGARWQYQLRTVGSLWQRYRGRPPGLRMQIDLTMPPASTESFTDVLVRVYPCDCSPERGIELLEDLGRRLLRSLRDHLHLPPDRRAEERIALVETVQVRPIYSESEIGPPFVAQTRNISTGGLGLDLPCMPPCDFLLVQLTPPRRAPLLVPVQGLYTHPRGGGRHLLGARFAWELVQRFRS